MLEGEKILITGASGKVAFPIARELAKRNEVWGAARLRSAADREKLAAAGLRPLPLDVARDDFGSLPGDFGYVLHAAVDVGDRDWASCAETNAQASGRLLHHCRSAKGLTVTKWPVRAVAKA